jgi:hypothetical protein
MGKPHKHAEIIKAWADGADIQYWDPQLKFWDDCLGNPFWGSHGEYRIKPDPKPDRSVLFYERASVDYGRMYTEYAPVGADISKHNLKLTFDGETGRLKAAEVIGQNATLPKGQADITLSASDHLPQD